jgi:hypothetical protein
MTLEAVIFSGIGTLAEVAELDRAAWNAAFRTHGIAWNWSWDVYAELMRHGGDRQLAARYGAHLGQVVDAETLDRTHQRQFATMWAGGVPLRPGVAVLQGVVVGAGTTTQRSRGESPGHCGIGPISAARRARAPHDGTEREPSTAGRPPRAVRDPTPHR